MAEYTIDKIEYDSNIYKLQDNVSGYAPLASPAFTGTPTAPTASSGDSSTQIATTAFVQDAMSGAGAGTVTSVGISNATNGGLSVSGSPITSSGSITVGHSNVLSSAQTTSAVYPIKIDKNGHISEYGSAVNIPSKTSDLTNDSGFITNPGYACSSSTITAYNGSVTTSSMGGMYAATFTPLEILTTDTIIVTFNNTEYELPLTALAGTPCYGEVNGSTPDFTHYPCLVAFLDSDTGMIITQSAGTYSVKIEGIVVSVTVTPCFQKAVDSVSSIHHLLDGIAEGSLRSSTSGIEGNNYALGISAVSEGCGTTASGDYSHAEGYYTEAIGEGSHAEGNYTTASGLESHAEGINSTASGNYSHAEGASTANSTYSHAEGGSTASGSYSHAEGYDSVASGDYSHAEGESTHAQSYASHAEGYYTTASGYYSHAEGYGSTASGSYSHAANYYTTANHRSQYTFGEYNILDPSSAAATNKGNYIEIVGNGTSTSARSNARTLDWDGNEVLAGKLTLGAAPTANMDAATKKYVDDSIPTVPTKTSDLTNDSGFITSYTDEKMKWTVSTSSNTYYPLVSTSTATTSTGNTLNGIDFYQYYNTAGGYRRLTLGNSTTYTSSGGAYGTIRLYGTSDTYYGDLNPGTIGVNSLTANRTWTLPDKTGTIALTSDIPSYGTDIPFSSTDANSVSAEILSIVNQKGAANGLAPLNASSKIDSTYLPTIVNTRGTPTSGGTTLSVVTTGDMYTWNSKTSNTGTVTKVTAGTGLSVGSTAGGNFTTSGTLNHTNSVTAQTTQAIYPIKIDACGHISAYGTAAGDYVTEQGTSGDWIYRKWNSGISECWTTATTTAKTTTSDGGGYVSDSAVTPSNFPANLFIATPNVQVTLNSTSITGSVTSTAAASTTSAGSYKLYRNTSNNGTQTKTFNFYCIGKWK